MRLPPCAVYRCCGPPPTICSEIIWTILLWVRPLADLDIELEHAYAKADLFEKTFKRKIRLVIQK